MGEGDKTFLHFPTTSDKPITLPVLSDVFMGDQAELEYYVEEMRRRHLTIVMLQGEDVFLLRRLVQGTRCPYWQQEENQCSRPLDPQAPCYNVGWIGGYTPSLPIKVVYPPSNRTSVIYEAGNRVEFRPRPWTIHEPQLKERDIIVRKYTGIRYELQNISEVKMRGLTMHQEFDTRELTQSTETFIYQVPVQQR